jgi:hypothetical protein
LSFAVMISVVMAAARSALPRDKLDENERQSG